MTDLNMKRNYSKNSIPYNKCLIKTNSITNLNLDQSLDNNNNDKIKLIDMFNLFYQENFHKILQTEKTTFLLEINSKIEEIIYYKHASGKKLENSVQEELKKLKKDLELLYDEDYNLLNKALVNYVISQKDFKYLSNYRKHCIDNTDIYAIHKCPSQKYGKFIEIQTNTIKNNYFSKQKITSYLICVDCLSCFYNNYILMFCSTCKNEYYSSILNNNENENLLPATWEKYHCKQIINEVMKCLKCRNTFYIDLNTKLLKCLNPLCNFSIKPESILWKCISCSEDFRSNATIYNPIEIQVYKKAILKTLIYQFPALPGILPCCKKSVDNLVFYHKKNCMGELFKGTVNDVEIIVCEKCHAINFYDKFLWTCPLCQKRFTLHRNKKNNLSLIPRQKYVNNSIGKENNNINYYDSIRGSNSSFLLNKKNNLTHGSSRQKKIVNNTLDCELNLNINNINNHQKGRYSSVGVFNSKLNKSQDHSNQSKDSKQHKTLYDFLDSKNKNEATSSNQNDNLKPIAMYLKYSKSKNKENISEFKTEKNNNNKNKNKININYHHSFNNNTKIINENESNKISMSKNLSFNKNEDSKEQIFSLRSRVTEIYEKTNEEKNFLNTRKTIFRKIAEDTDENENQKKICEDINNNNNKSKDLQNAISSTDVSSLKSLKTKKYLKYSKSKLDFSALKKKDDIDPKKVIFHKISLNEFFSNSKKNNKFTENNNIKNSLKRNNLYSDNKNNYSETQRKPFFQKKLTCSNYNDNSQLKNDNSSLIKRLKKNSIVLGGNRLFYKSLKTNKEDLSNNKSNDDDSFHKSLLNFRNQNNNKKMLIKVTKKFDPKNSFFKKINNDKSSPKNNIDNTKNKEDELNNLILSKEAFYDIVKICKIPKFEDTYYKYIKPIGEGSFGIIYLVKEIKTKKCYALKRVICQTKQQILKHIYEFETLYFLKHENLIKIYNIQFKYFDTTTYSIYVLMEKADCDLCVYIRHRISGKKFFTEKEIIHLLKQLSNVLCFLQKNNIAHRDIKPQNILIFPNDLVKLTDLGEAKNISTNLEMANTIRGSELYMSPLLYNAFKNANKDVKHNAFKSDVFSLGYCFLFAMCLSIKAIECLREVENMRIIRNLVNKNVDKTKYSKELINVILKMIEIDENKRYDFIELNGVIKKQWGDL